MFVVKMDYLGRRCCLLGDKQGDHGKMFGTSRSSFVDMMSRDLKLEIGGLSTSCTTNFYLVDFLDSSYRFALVVRF